MSTKNESETRRKFIAWGIASAAVLAAFKFITPSPEKKDTVKMLTQDGKLVEVDISKRIYGERKKISDEQLKNWVSKK